ncbi:MAG TPA: hypothetical protein VLH77_00010 [Gammaproteobacteria bacterium]|nr:hypothetical protein [Gammaproteobacteria bacterium]
MWLHQESKAPFFKAMLSALWLTGIFFSSGAYAVSIPDLGVMLTNFATSVPTLMKLVTAGAYVMGMFLVISSIMGMKHFGEMRTMASQEHSLTGPLVGFFVGVAMLYLPSTVRSGLSTFWVTTNPYAYLNTASDQYTIFINACYGIIQLIGVIALIRGLLIMKQVGGGRAQQATLKAGLAHLVGGILCINIYNTIQVLEATVGWTS